jgi:hypothetical protein
MLLGCLDASLKIGSTITITTKPSNPTPTVPKEEAVTHSAVTQPVGYSKSTPGNRARINHNRAPYQSAQV